ncbi:hypothetical protein [Micromonospora sp. HUAS LYJ1]|uniref:hypothetical protein n=1 Tax=Micromonospora sp. HUAS LYJ1 TaxID=3061626 RepID=UPI0026718E7B|nr:hypothetical protein [Micromonospora sp. HUAS LYJ1]WKU03001.1 hypothetical protein Q2K16_19125 [Micromonospora sp. HUAS LYJ1]
MAIFKRIFPFDSAEAAKIAEGVISDLRSMPYGELTNLCGDSERSAIRGSRGIVYSVVTFGIMEPNGVLRVSVAVDNGGFSSLKPLVRDFLMKPDGSIMRQWGWQSELG